MIGKDAHEYQDFLTLHKAQLAHAGIPEHYYRTVYEKIELEKYDSGDYMMMLTDGVNWEVQSTTTIESGDANTIFLVDHCWTFHAEQVKKALRGIPGLAQRMSSLTGVGYPDGDGYESEEETGLEELIEKLTEKIWDLAETYTIQKDDEKVTVCYMMDELGSRISHSETPNMKMAPFFHITKQFAVTLMWPIEDEIPPETSITRDITLGETDGGKRAARLAIFRDNIEIDTGDLRMGEVEKLNPYTMYGRKDQTLPDDAPDDSEHPASLRVVSATPADPIKVFTDLKFMAEALTDPLFKVVNSDKDADFISSSDIFDKFKEFYKEHPTKIINQFPNENVVCCKDLLLKVARRSMIPDEDRERSDELIIERLNSESKSWAEDMHPWWFPIGFDLVNELPVFVRNYLEREAAGLDNSWIVKPWNLSRGRGTYVTSNLAMIVKLAYTSPKVVQKYIEDPVLFYRGDVGRVKFDVRYVILLKSVKPLKIFKYNVFWLRFANKPFALDEFDEYEKHFTVMNYSETAELKQIGDLEFMEMFEQQYPDHPWEGIDRRICEMIKECFTSASCLPPPRGMAHSAQSRAIYALDMMLKWNEDKTEMIPQLLECNFNPDNQRACKYHPNFYNHCLKALLSDVDISEIPVTEIS